MTQKTLATTTVDYKAVFEAMPGNSVLVEANSPYYHVLAVTDGYTQIAGRTQEILIGKGFFELFPSNPDEPGTSGQGNVRASFEQVINQKTAHRIPVQRYELIDEDGISIEHFWSFQNKPVFDSSGEVIYIIHTIEDATLQVKAEQREERIKGLEKTYSLFMQAPVAINILKGPELIIELANAPSLEIWGKGAEVIGQSLLKVVPELQGKGYKELVEQIMKSGKPHRAYEVNVSLVRNGRQEDVYFNWVLQPYYERGQSEATGIIAFATEVTEQVVERQRASVIEARYQDLIAQATVATAVYIGREMKIEYANDAMIRLWGKDRSAIGKTVREALPELEGQPFHQQLDQVFTTGETYWGKEDRGEIVVDGRLETFYFNFSYKALRNTSGEIYGILNMATDVTEQVLAKKKVEESERNLRNTILQAPIAMCILKGADYVIEIANEKMFNLWGRDGKDLLNQPIFSGLPEVKNQGFEALLFSVFTKGETVVAYEQPVTLPRNGKLEVVYVNFVYEPFREGDGSISGVMAAAIDVTGQVMARKKIEQKNEELAFVMDIMPTMVWHSLPDGSVEFFNQVYLDYTGLSIEELKGQRWISLMHPDDIENTSKLWQKSLATGEYYQVEHRYQGKDGHYRWFLTRGVPLKDEKGNIVKWYGSSTDIEEHKRDEALLEQRVRERTQELEEFTYVSHHDLKEPIRKILLFSDMMRSDSYDRLTEASQRRLNRISESARRMNIALRDVLNFASLSREEQLTMVDLNEVMATVHVDLELVIQEKSAIIHTDELPMLKANPGQMHQLFYNLINNALKFSKPDQTPVITVSCRKLHATMLLSTSGLVNDKQYYEFVVQDNGIGFNPEASEKIFALFQRLHSKDDYEGTGIGLALCKKVVQNHHGKIWAESIPDKGATFTILLPAEL